MDDAIEIDLRKYIQFIFKHWLWIIGFTAIAAVIAFSISSLGPTTYQAASLVAVTQPRNQLNFDPKFQTVYAVQPANKAYLDLAGSDDVLTQLFDQWKDRPSSVKNLFDLRRNIVQVGNGSDATIIKLIVNTSSPEMSSRLANQWATIFIKKANDIYLGQDQQLKFLDTQMADAKTDLDKAENALIDFQAQNQLQILTNQLNSTLQSQSDYLAIQRNLTYLGQSVQGLRSQFAANPGNKATTADELSVLLLQIQTYNNQISTSAQQSQTRPDGSSSSSQMTSNVNPFPLQIQVTDPAVLGGLDAQSQISFLDNLSKSIQDRTVQVESSLKALAPQILNLQQSVEQYQARQDQLQRTQELAQENYTTLSQKIDETNISAQDPSNGLQLASSAMPPSQAAPRGRLRNTLVAGIAGGLLALLFILALEWWRGQEVPKDK
jgi:uncharacterized protein involved in exopolysaccharide biosynthesis